MAGRPIPKRDVRRVTPREEPAAILAALVGAQEDATDATSAAPEVAPATSHAAVAVGATEPRDEGEQSTPAAPAATAVEPERPRRFSQPVVPVEQPRRKMIPFTTALPDDVLEELRDYCRINRVQIVDVVNRGVELALDEAYQARAAK